MKTSKEKTIEKLLKKSNTELSLQEKIALIYDKFYKKQRITYEEYAILLFATNDELCILYKNVKYQIDYGISNVTAMYITEYDGQKKISERSENYSSVIELLDKFKIEGKAIKDIWNDIKF